MIFPLLLALFAGCDTVADNDFATCSVTVAISPFEAQPGSEVSLVGWPITEPYDSAVYLNGTRATVLSTTPSAVVTCQECRTENECSMCSECFACASACEGTLVFEVPELAAGPTTVVLGNRWGQSRALAFTVLEPTGDTGDTGDTDSGDTDSGDTDSGDTDSDDTDSEDTDSGSADSDSTED